MNWDATYDFPSQDFGFCSSFCGILARFFQFQLWFEIIIVHDFLEGCVSSNMLCEDSNNCLSTYFASFRRFPSSRRPLPPWSLNPRPLQAGFLLRCCFGGGCAHRHRLRNRSIDWLTDWLHPPLLLHCGKVEEWKRRGEDSADYPLQTQTTETRKRRVTLGGSSRERERKEIIVSLPENVFLF